MSDGGPSDPCRFAQARPNLFPVGYGTETLRARLDRLRQLLRPNLFRRRCSWAARRYYSRPTPPATGVCVITVPRGEFPARIPRN